MKRDRINFCAKIKRRKIECLNTALQQKEMSKLNMISATSESQIPGASGKKVFSNPARPLGYKKRDRHLPS
jgi:hypothetical protein